mmetsp:Transcript_2886/g.5851  ORF Transcript_2886/g.5851 Transcript_2886/m.5851 type:complete len:367 (-) Transcript_2886:246-1346(-)
MNIMADARQSRRLFTWLFLFCLLLSINIFPHDFQRHVKKFSDFRTKQTLAHEFEKIDELGEIKHAAAIFDHLPNKSKYSQQEQQEFLKSPACHPHFNVALPNGGWTNTTKFKRLYFYHARKAGGTSMSMYLRTVAQYYGLEFEQNEWTAMEEPGTFENSTFYVTSLREPIDRSISHFKYEGRWNCKSNLMNHSFIPSESNANKLETWQYSGGHSRHVCRKKKKKTRFFLGLCAVNCYTQWYSGLSCPEWNIPFIQQYQVARKRVFRYNMIIVMEMLKDPKYVQAIEKFFGVAGVTIRKMPYCEKESHEANRLIPLVVSDEYRENMTSLNQLDIKLYHQLTDCLNSDTMYNNFGEWQPDRWVYNMPK